jgi:hypothetical protein
MAKQQRPIGAEDLTPWFPPEVKPVHVGEYETDEFFAVGFARRWWNGSEWSVFYRDSDTAAEKHVWRKSVTGVSDIRWRGLSKKPE